MEAEIAKLGASKLNDNTKAAQIQALNDITDEPGDSENFGEVDVLSTLGVTSLPWPATKDGYAEGVILRNCGNRNGICVGARDTRTAKAIGNAKPGDTILHSTGPNQAAQVQCKEEKRQVVLFSKDNSGKGMVVAVDGKNEQIQAVAFGMTIELRKNAGIKLDTGQGASIILKGGDVWINGNIHVKGMKPGFAIALCPPSGSPGGPASTPLVPMGGVGP